MNPMKELQDEFEFYLTHQDELVEKYNGKYVVIKNDVVLGAYDNELAAIKETQKQHEAGTFLVQFVSPGDAAYTQVFHSKVPCSGARASIRDGLGYGEQG